MADTLTNIELPDGEWVDLYATASLTPGDQIEIQNIGGTEVYLYSGSTAPASVPGDAYNLLPVYGFAQNVAGDAGAWAAVKNNKGLVNIRLAV